MKKIQIYPSDALYDMIAKSAEQKGVSVNALCCGLLSEHFFDDTAPEKSFKAEEDLIAKIFNEIEVFLAGKGDDFEFVLRDASKTYASFEDDVKYSLVDLSPSTVRAKVGRNFANQIGKDKKFKNVEVAKRDDGKPKRGLNNAITYKLIDLDES